ncbi:MAG: metallophosphoesterase [Flavobacteriaceae bacterium]|nr:metallophosphoesterase [Flavobacteriaceae bacterium]
MKRYAIFLLLVAFISSCATFKPQYKTVASLNPYPKNKEIEHTFYLIGDAGNSDLGKSSEALKVFKKEMERASKNSTALFLGDNIYEKGIPKKSSKEYKLAKHRIDIQIDAVKNFKGQPIFIPGNHDWYSGLKGLKRQEKIVTKALGENSFLPKSGCPIDKVHISDNIELIIIDSQWYVTNWNSHPTMNDDCDIKTRENFFNEFTHLIKKARGKTTIVALHHPLFTNGAHGGEFSFSSHFDPLPILGTLKNLIRKTSGVSNADIQNRRFIEFKNRLMTIAHENKSVVFVSGHEHNLQYLIKDNLPQIVSGSGSKGKAVRNRGAGLFGYATPGFAKMVVFKDGSSHLSFYSVNDKKVVFETQVFPPKKQPKFTSHKSFPPTMTSSIYTKEETDKSAFYKFLWGERYRKYYSIPITVPTVNLDTLFGGVTIGRKGGGTQSKSLRLITKDGKKQYVMRAMRKQATQYLQRGFFENQYLNGKFDNTATEMLMLDVFAGSYPYAPFVIADLSDGAGVYHLNPKLYYIPKQKALGNMNNEYGDELYMIEEHASDGHGDKASFGYSNKVLSTYDVMKKIHKNEKNVIDEKSYIRARLFDMLIGDWDRHQDQWRWLEFKENGKKVYRPLPRDRDQAFSKMGDGFLFKTAIQLMPMARLLRNYSDDLTDVKGVYVEAYPLDMEFIQKSGLDVWLSEAKKIQKGVTDEMIEKAFLNIPKEVRDETIDKIKQQLKSRRGNLQKIAKRYFKLVSKNAVVRGTNKDDWFDIERLPQGKTKVTAYRIKGGKKATIFHERTYNHKDTKEIWIYGLDDNDIFCVFGKGNDKIRVRLIGGQNKDTYNIVEGGKVTFYDYKSKKSVIKTRKGHKKFTDNYHTNVYDYKKFKNNTTQIIPTFGANPDDGFRAGFDMVNTNFGFEQNPFTSQHKIKASYYFATNGFYVGYSGEFANVLYGLNFGIDAHFNSPNYATNFFGFGTETINPNAENADKFNMNYNRVKIRTLKIMPSLIWRGQLGGHFKLGLFYENNQVQRTKGRFIANLPTDNPIFDAQGFYGVDAIFQFKNKDVEAFPTNGFQFSLNTGFKQNAKTNKGFGYIIPEIGFDYKLVPSGQLVLATNFRGHINLGDNFEFYQGATLGANNGLRGYRNQRFTGKNSYVQSTDLRWNIADLKTNILPISLGIYAGVDYGRVWLKNDTSNKWQNSYGGGFFINLTNMVTANISAFNSNDGLRIGFKMGFDF